MNIVHVTPFYQPVIGGVEDVVKKITEHLARKGNEVYVLTYNRLRINGEGLLPQEEKINGVYIKRLNPFFTWKHGSYSSSLTEVLNDIKPDVVHVHVWRHPHVFQVAKLKEKIGFKAILHFHAPFHNYSQLGLITWTYHNLVDLFGKSFLKKYDIFIALTPFEKNILISKLNIKKEKIVVIPNGIDDKINMVLKLQDECNVTSIPTILYIGRISKSKNIDYLLKAMEYVKKEIEKANLILAGPDEGMYKKYRGSFNNSIKYLGIVSEKTKYKLYIKSKIFVHPAIYEPFGISLLEAQFFGKPCIITGTGGQLYASPPNFSSLYASPSPKDIANKIVTLLKNEELYIKLSKNGKKWASRHLWSKILPKYERLYRY